MPASAKDGLAGQVLDLLPNDVGITIVTPADAPQRLQRHRPAQDACGGGSGWSRSATLAGALGDQPAAARHAAGLVDHHRRARLSPADHAAGGPRPDPGAGQAGEPGRRRRHLRRAGRQPALLDAVAARLRAVRPGRDPDLGAPGPGRRASAAAGTAARAPMEQRRAARAAAAAATTVAADGTVVEVERLGRREESWPKRVAADHPRLRRRPGTAAPGGRHRRPRARALRAGPLGRHRARRLRAARSGRRRPCRC